MTASRKKNAPSAASKRSSVADRERDRIRQEVYSYAVRFAGTKYDFDPDLEAASLEHLAEVLPAEPNWDFRRKVLRGMADVRAGRTISDAAARKRFKCSL